MTLPQRIVFFWAQGAAEAPRTVRRCWEAWREKNPGWHVEIADSAQAKALFAEAGLAHAPKTMQGQADVFRVLDLAKNGGVYVDAATVPIAPLDAWVHDWARDGFFAFHDPYRKRPIENWCLASAPGNLIMATWAKHILAYWDRPRVIQTLKRSLDPGWKGDWAARRDLKQRDRTSGSPRAPKQVIEPKNRVWAVRPGGGAQRGLHPYFWPHYVFDLALEREPEMRAAWAKMPKHPSYKELMLRHWKKRYGQMTPDDIRALMEGARMQKLALNTEPSAQQMEQIFAAAGLSPYEGTAS